MTTETIPHLTTPQILSEARALIEKPERWLHGEGFAADADGKDIPLSAVIAGAPAASYCAYGAVFAVCRDTDSAAATEALRAALPYPQSDWAGAAHFNDAFRTTHADVLALFDRAIEQQRLREQGQQRLYGGPSSKDALVASVLELEGLACRAEAYATDEYDSADAYGQYDSIEDEREARR